ncbi:hypothetical protein Poli38472_011968 [Pythium oligandrum]|uniref:Protein kinase domain-containing protein n=1 Tax=Pythium oligandrum TaxID=41045 RepID=A0A8K1CQK7_PYTOL|nr:hypothetical protein Poli38472_011968 [Pythium oligandrum]|eukprot:TMW66852.1 hypothetical protein Poli38472_011968 [Pythium oligandrum]
MTPMPRATTRRRRVHALLTLGVVASSQFAPVDARQDVPAQFYKLYQQQKDISPVTFAPDPMPDSITERLLGMDFSSLPIALQHAVLWDSGLVASSDTTRQAYVQVKVPCGSTMNDIFLPRDTISEKAKCGMVDCNTQILLFAFKNCSGHAVEPLTKCGILDGAPVNTVSVNPLWVEDGDIDTEPGFQVYLHENTERAVNTSSSSTSEDGSTSVGETTLFTIQEKPTLKLEDTRGSCPNKATFIIPCRRLTTAVLGDDNGNAWCDPVSGVLVDLWLSDEHTARQSKGMNTTSKVFIVLFAAAAAVALAFGFLLYRNRRSRGASTASGYLRHPVHTPGHLQTDLTSSNNAAYSDGSPMDTGEAEKRNLLYRERSTELAAFCDDQELLLKRISYSSLHFSSLIARGANGEVWRGEYAGQVVAIKRLLKERHSDILSMEIFAREIRLAATLEHPNIVQFVGMSWRSLADLCMVSEFLSMGDLSQFLLSKESRNLTWKNEKMAIALDLANALVYLHSLIPVIIHRDLKSLNVLLNDKFEAKLSDFGLSRERSFDETMTMGVGTLLWTAPEVLRGDRYSEKADIYSYGIVLSELDTCLPPYSLNEQVTQSKMKSAQLLPMIRSGQITPQFRSNVPKELHELALSCLDITPEKRPNAMQIVYLLRSKVVPALQ